MIIALFVPSQLYCSVVLLRFCLPADLTSAALAAEAGVNISYDISAGLNASGIAYPATLQGQVATSAI